MATILTLGIVASGFAFIFNIIATGNSISGKYSNEIIIKLFSCNIVFSIVSLVALILCITKYSEAEQFKQDIINEKIVFVSDTTTNSKHFYYYDNDGNLEKIATINTDMHISK